MLKDKFKTAEKLINDYSLKEPNYKHWINQAICDFPNSIIVMNGICLLEHMVKLAKLTRITRQKHPERRFEGDFRNNGFIFRDDGIYYQVLESIYCYYNSYDQRKIMDIFTESQLNQMSETVVSSKLCK